MTQPFEVRRDARERVGAGGDPPVISVWRTLLRWLIVAAFLFRAALSVLDVQSATSDSVTGIPVLSSISFGAVAPAWPLLWGVLALISGIALALRVRIGWLLAVAVAVAYLVAGISDTTAQIDTTGSVSNAVGTIVIGLVVPIVILSGLLSIRMWYLPSARPLNLAHGHDHR